ncbi:hypothetical protein HDU85_001466 [Gaertneriomyces sp. JEL0708]|nr:hypothetical protein HDU85_001466 [Gaertneriomyces sp. JEL0708]
MDDLGDLAWKSAGLTSRPASRNASGTGTPLRELPVGTTVSGSTLGGVRTNSTGGGYATPPRGYNTPAYTTPSSYNVQSSYNSTLRSNLSAPTSRATSPGPAKFSNTTPISANGGKVDLFGGLVNFGSHNDEKPAGTNNQNSNGPISGPVGRGVPLQRPMNEFGFHTSPGVAKASNPLTSTTASPGKPGTGAPFSDIAAFGSGKPLPIQSIPIRSPPASNPHVQSHPPQSNSRNVTAPSSSAWDFDFLASKTNDAPYKLTPSGETSKDPFDIEFLNRANVAAGGNRDVKPDEEDDVLGLLARPVDEVLAKQLAAKPNAPESPVSTTHGLQAPLSPPSRRAAGALSEDTSTVELDHKTAQIIDMGFDAAVARNALEASQGNLDVAIEMLVSQRDAESQINDQTRARESPQAARPLGENILPSRDEYYTRRYPERNTTHSGVRTVEQTVIATAKTATSLAKSVFEFGKKKLGEVVVKAGDRSHQSHMRYDGYDHSDQHQWDGRRGRSRFSDTSDEDNVGDVYSPPAGSAPTARSQVPPFSNPEPVLPFKETPPNTIFGQSPPLRPVTPPPRPMPTNVTLTPRKPTVVATPGQLQESQQHKDLGGRAFQNGDYALAIEEYNKAIQVLPSEHASNAVLYSNRAAARLKVASFMDAVSDCEKSLSLLQEDEVANRELILKTFIRKAQALESLEKWEEARDVWREAVGKGVGKLGNEGLSRCGRALSSTIVGTKEAHSALPVQQATHASLFAEFETPSYDTSTDTGQSAPMRADITREEVNSSHAVQKLREEDEKKEREEGEKLEMKDRIDAMLSNWSFSKQSNLRALLGSLHTVLWDGAGWKAIGLSELVTPQQVKKAYVRAVAKVHPDKLSQEATVEQRMVANAVFSTLNKAWEEFKVQNGLS